MVKTKDIVEAYRQNMCTLCLEGKPCNKPLIPSTDSQSKLTTLRCDNYRRYENEQTEN